MRTSMRRLCLALCAATALALPLSAAAGERSAGVIYLDNGAIRVGVDLGRGGNITYLARARGAEANVIHEVQQSYSGADWNASASGGHVLASLDDGRSLYTKVVPRAPDGAACACVLETWVTLRGVSAEVRHRLTRTAPRHRAGSSCPRSSRRALRTACSRTTVARRTPALRCGGSARAPAASAARGPRSLRPSTGRRWSGRADAASASSFPS